VAGRRRSAVSSGVASDPDLTPAGSDSQADHVRPRRLPVNRWRR